MRIQSFERLFVFSKSATPCFCWYITTHLSSDCSNSGIVNTNLVSQFLEYNLLRTDLRSTSSLSSKKLTQVMSSSDTIQESASGGSSQDEVEGGPPSREELLVRADEQLIQYWSGFSAPTPQSENAREPALIIPQDVDSIKLQVGERRFETKAGTLRGCRYFANILSERWYRGPRSDGYYYVDRDGDIFVQYVSFSCYFPWTEPHGELRRVEDP